MAKTLHIAVNDKVATYCQRDGVIVCGNSDYEIEFAFDSEWSSHAVKTARFIHGKTYEDVVFEGNTVAVPVMRGITSLAVGVFSGNLKTTTPALITCRKSVLCEGGSPSEPTPDVYAQIIELLNKGGGGGGSGNDGDVQTLEEMLQGFEKDPGSVKAYVDSAVGGAGADGGHYTPSVVDNGDGTMTISFTANKEGMAAVSPVTVTLPQGADGAHVIAVDEMGGDDTKTTYKMRFSDGSGYDFDVYHGWDGKDGADGVGIKSIAKTSTSGLVDTYTITLTNNTTDTFTVTNGEPGKDGTIQLTPLYAESVEWLERNGEQGKLYVLSDKNDPEYGFIFAYQHYSEGGGEPLFTNLADPTNKAVPNTGDLAASENINGWWDGYRFDASGNFIKSTVEGAFISNAFPLIYKAKIKIRGKLIANTDIQHNLNFSIYNSETAYVTNKAMIPLTLQVMSPDKNGNYPNTAVNGSAYLVEERDPDDPEIVTYTYDVGYGRAGLSVTAANCVMGRIAGINLGEDAEIIVTYDDIAYTEPATGYKWMSTGQAFVPANYESKITGLRKDVDKLQKDMADIKQNGVASKGASFDYTAYGSPILYLNGNTTGMDKDNKVTLDYVYREKSGTCTVKWQGHSSLAYPKKNYTITFDNAFEAAEGWGVHKKYCIKANFMDFSHSRNLCSAKLWGQIVKSRATPDARLAALPNGGAVDGFPIVLVINNEYMGLYTFNIPKDGWMFGMGSGTQEAILCADKWTASNQATLFRNEATCDGSDFEIEYATDEDNTAWVAESLNRLINACLASDGTDIDTTIAQYVDIDSAIDHLIFVPLIHGADCVKKNYIIATYDGVKWFFSAYDMDSTFGITWDGGYYKEAAGAWKAAVGASGQYPVRESMMDNKLLQLLWHNKQDRVKARYAELRGGVMSEANVAHEFLEFAAAINKAYFDEEPKVWPAIPATGANNANQIVTHYMLRTPKIDKDFGL